MGYAQIVYCTEATSSVTEWLDCASSQTFDSLKECQLLYCVLLLLDFVHGITINVTLPTRIYWSLTVVSVLLGPHWRRGVTGKFFWGGKVIFPDFFVAWNAFFPVWNFRCGRPKTSFSGFEKWEAKVLSSFSIFHLPFYNFPSFLLNFDHFSLFFLASFFPVGQQKFPGQKSQGALCLPPPPPPRLLRHCID